MPPTAAKPDRSFWRRLVSGARRLLPRAWAGEAQGVDDPGYLVHPYDLYAGIKGIEPALYGLLMAYQRGRNKQQRPAGQAYSDAYVRNLARLLERYNPFAQAMLSALRS